MKQKIYLFQSSLLRIDNSLPNNEKYKNICTTYTLTTDTSDRCLICGKLEWEHDKV